MPSPKIFVLGLGRVGRTLARLLPVTALRFSQIRALPKDALIFLCWPDALIEARLPALGVHKWISVSGSLPARPDVATFHPLIGFAKNGLTTLEGVPIGLGASTRVSRAELTRLARMLKARPFPIPGDRALYHAAAVTAGAGVITAWQAAIEMLSAAGLSERAARETLVIIAQQALGNAHKHGVAKALTGPVVRNDERTIALHEKALRKHRPDVLPLYRALIRQMRRVKN